MQTDFMMQPKISLLQDMPQLQPLDRLSKHLGGPQIFLKRDDLGPSGGGNKIRKFERQFADARAVGADTLILAAHSQSNCARELVGCAAQCGFEVVIAVKDLVERKDVSYLFSGNALLMDLMNTRFELVDPERDFMEGMIEIAEILRKGGKSPYILPFGASDNLGVRGYIESGREILQLCKDLDRHPDTIVVATGTCGTQAGLVIAVENEASGTNVQGFSILHDEAMAQQEINRLITETIGHSNINTKIKVDSRALGAGYGQPTKECVEAIRLVAQLEGVFLDPVYTGKAMAGFIGWLPESGLGSNDTVVFVHTGGLPLLFAYQEIFR